MRIELFPDKKGRWRWRKASANHQIQGTSHEGFASKSNARRKSSAEQATAPIRAARCPSVTCGSMNVALQEDGRFRCADCELVFDDPGSPPPPTVSATDKKLMPHAEALLVCHGQKRAALEAIAACDEAAFLRGLLATGLKGDWRRAAVAKRIEELGKNP